MIFFHCQVCKMSLSAEETRQGKLVRCPNCLTAVTVPQQSGVPAGVSGSAVAGSRTGASATPPRVAPPPVRRDLPTGSSRVATGVGRRYGFHCVYCSSRLEATESMAGQAGQCPTCGSSITIPILDRHGRLIDPVTQEILKPDPHPVHAYAAAGQRAPIVLRQEDGSQRIRCTKCGRMSPVNANNCAHCGMPFTMEGTSDEAMLATNGFAIAAFVLGIIGIPFSCTVVVPVLAIVFGTIALVQISAAAQVNGRWQAIAGIACGVIGLGISLMFYIR